MAPNDFRCAVSLLPLRPPIFGRFTLKPIAIALLTLLASVAHSANLSVRVQDAPAEGTLVFQVYDTPNTFGDFRDPVKEFRMPVNRESVYRLDDVPAGELAVLVYVDENENGLIDKNFIGIPREPLGISNDYRPKGPPAFARAKIAVIEGETTSIDIAIYKVLGNRGRLGVGAGVIGRSSPYVGSDTTVLKPIPAISVLSRSSRPASAGLSSSS